MQHSKQSVWLLWLGSLAAIALGSGWVALVGKIVFWATLIAHLVEYLLKRPLFARVGGSAGHHFVQTMIYGLFHWKPLEEAESRAPDA